MENVNALSVIFCVLFYVFTLLSEQEDKILMAMYNIITNKMLGQLLWLFFIDK